MKECDNYMIDTKIDTLIAVCEERNFTKAAEKLSLTQPAVSQHIRQLEENLGIKIFNRTEKNIKLTNEGEIALKYAKRMKMLYQNLFHAISDEKAHVKRWTVGVTPTAENNIISAVFAKYCNENSGVHITIITDSIKNLYMKLKIYEIDIAIIEGKIIDKNFKSIMLDTDNLALIVANEHPLAKKNIVTLNELKEEKFILRLPNSGTRSLFESFLHSNNESIENFNIILEVDNISTIKELVQMNMGVSILARSACTDELKKNKLKVLSVENLSLIREINIVYHQDFEHINVLNDIIQIYHRTIGYDR